MYLFDGAVELHRGLPRRVLNFPDEFLDLISRKRGLQFTVDLQYRSIWRFNRMNSMDTYAYHAEGSHKGEELSRDHLEDRL